MAYELPVPIFSPSRLSPFCSPHSSGRHSRLLPGRLLARLALAALASGACSGGDGLLLPSEGEPAAISVLRGDAQQGRVGEPLSSPLIFEVTDTRDRPVEGAMVIFELTSAGPGARLIPDTATTDANGQANVQMVLGTRIGAQDGSARVAVSDKKHVPQVAFSAMALPENANIIAPVAGEDQTGRVGAPLADRLVVKVTDAFDNPIEGVPISWTAQGGGSVSAATVSTDEEGLASVERILGATAGQQTTLAGSEGLAGSPVTFVHTALAGDASLLTIVSGDNQTGQVGSELPAELVVRLVDGEGNGVANTPLNWEVAIGGGSVAAADDMTDQDGRASARWILGPTRGANRLDAVVVGVGAASFHADGTPGAPSTLAIRTQPPQAARAGVELARAPVVQLLDDRGNAVSQPGVQIGAAIGSGGGNLTGTRQRLTDENGRATFSDLAIVGSPGSYTLVFSSPGYASATSAPIDLRAVPTTTVITGDSPDPSAPGAAVTVTFRVTSEGPTPTGTVTVSDGIDNCTGTLSAGAGSCVITLSTSGDRTLKATYPGESGLDGSSGFEGHKVQAPPPQNRPPTADFTWACQALTCQFTDQSSDPDGFIASWSWSFGDPGGSSSQRNPSHTFPAAGTYTVALGVTDNGGAATGSTKAVTVSEPPPPPPQNKAPHADFDSHCTDLDCSFTDKSRDDDGAIASWQWSFGDGQGSTEPNPSHSYAQAGKYKVVLTVTDNNGAPDTKDHDVDVKAPPPAPTTVTIVSDAPDPSDFGAPITVQFTVTSPEGTPPGTVLVTEPQGGSCSAEVSTGSCTLVPGGSGTRDLTATYQGSPDFNPSSNKEEHTVNEPPPPNQPPVAANDQYQMDQDATLTVSAADGVLSNDSDPDQDPLSAGLQSQPSSGTVTLNSDGSFDYTPQAGFVGDDSFTYVASDGSQTSNTATVTITVNPTATPPATP